MSFNVLFFKLSLAQYNIIYPFFSQPQKQQDDTTKDRKTEGEEADIEDCEKEELAAEAEIDDDEEET